MKPTVVLVVPPLQGLLEGFSHGLISLANYLSSHEPDVPVHILDLGFTPLTRVDEDISAFLADVSGEIIVGLTTTTASYQTALRVAQSFKALDRSTTVVFGGHHASAQDDTILRHHKNDVDCVIRGEGERPLLELVRRYPDTSSVPNLSYLQRGVFRRNPPGTFISQEELDAILPTYSGLGSRSAPGKFGHVTYVSARGCPLKCFFCSVANDRVRAKSTASVLRDLACLVGEHGYRRIAIEDNFFAHSAKRTLELCSALAEFRRDLPFTWDCQTRVESMRRDDVRQAMEAAGCEAVYLGVEAFDPDQLLYLGKTSSPGPYLEAVHQVIPPILSSKMECYVNLQVGVPGIDGREMNMRSLRALGKLAAARSKTIQVFPQLHVIYPGTKHFHDALAESRFGPEAHDIFESFTSWEAKQAPVLMWLGKHFAHGVGGIPEGILARDRLRRGAFDVDADAVLEIVNHLDEIDSIPGISVFRYGSFLVQSHRETRDADCNLASSHPRRPEQ